MLTAGQLSAFLKSDQAEAVPSEATAQEARDILKKIRAQIVQQGRTADGFTFITTAFLPLNFATSVFYLLSAI